MSAVHLENCPFCGEEPAFVHSTYDASDNDPTRDYVRVECSCGICTADEAYNTRRWGKPVPDEAMKFDAERKAAAFWNRRADPTPIFNLNDRFAVTLTEEGAMVMTAWYEQFPAAYRKSAEPGMVLMEPLWHIMQIFGAQMIMGRAPVFVENKLELKEQG
ncbi:Lar family restriction alleviation protein [Herbaspirillum huttiense]|uniref:Lar family restriction alleviation protein n=1 Tax=Herbaspirillum huttiense subsp. lycopersici TaxID=3074428 RepID=A0ABU2EG16_9BURK|nr:Lar family restriction alleviation protein [Herbaspirillum huttiense]MDR9847075.1 Lar family restriction alleviation protein [Herbaspirillum huttiense SE1]